MSTPNEGSDRIDYQETPDIAEVHASVEREKPEPSADVTPMPMWLTGVCAVATVWAGVYFGIFNGGLSGNVFNEYESSPAVLFPLPAKAGGKAAEVVQVQTLAQQGKGIFQANCAVCHQATGQGIPGQFPPLAKSEWVLGSEKRMIGILLKGLQGPVTVHGQKGTYTGNMSPWEAALSPKKIAAVASYVRQEWGNTAPEISEAKVVAAKKEFTAQAAQWTEAQLLQIPADATLPDEGGAAKPAAPGAAAPAPASPAAAPAATPAPAAAAPAPAPAVAANAPAAPAGAAAPAAQVAAPAAVVTTAPVVAAATPEQLAEGKKYYMTICIACHQPTGLGLPMVFPPLTKSPYVNGSAERFAAIILKGNNPPFTVDGKLYAATAMPPQEAVLDDAKIASVMTFVRASFENSAPPVTTELVAATRKKLIERKTPWTQKELDEWKE